MCESNLIESTAEPFYTVTIGAKTPSRIPYAMGSAEITFHVYSNDVFDDKLDDAKEKLQEALSAALIVAEEAKE